MRWRRGVGYDITGPARAYRPQAAPRPDPPQPPPPWVQGVPYWAVRTLITPPVGVHPHLASRVVQRCRVAAGRIDCAHGVRVRLDAPDRRAVRVDHHGKDIAGPPGRPRAARRSSHSAAAARARRGRRPAYTARSAQPHTLRTYSRAFSGTTC